MSEDWSIINKLRNFGYSKRQAIFIVAARKDSPLVDIDYFFYFEELFTLNEELEDRVVEQIVLGMIDEVDFLRYVRYNLNGSQMREIRKGLKSNINVSFYEDPKYDETQMYAIRKGLEAGVSIAEYTELEENGEPRYSGDRMLQMYERLMEESNLI